ncbi:MAG TPA: hypothetical protein VN089_03790 [Duganella sp.]|nr:hypothetical protein [Duganella sp.]
MKTIFSAAGLAASLILGLPGMAQTTATMTQTGANNSASIEQEGTRERLAVITQIGNDNIAGGEGKEGGIVQRNSRVLAFITQRGSHNVAGVVQDNIAPHGEASIDQLGSDNVALVREQSAFTTGTEVRQEGTRNVALLSQLYGDIGMRARQTGADNTITINQEQASYGGPLVEQDGVGNSATVTLYNNGHAGSNLAQTGTLNEANITQENSQFNRGMGIVQNGNGNRANAASSGVGNMSLITQTGDGNAASLRGVVSTSESIILQTGNLNSATISQNAVYPGGPRSDNIARITQAGDGFVADIAQAGSGNAGTIHQH